MYTLLLLFVCSYVFVLLYYYPHGVCITLELTGIDVLDILEEEEDTTGQEAIAVADNNDDNMEDGGGGRSVRELVLTYVLPSVSGVCGCVVVCVVVVFAGRYLRRLRKRSRCVEAAAQRNSHSDTE